MKRDSIGGTFLVAAVLCVVCSVLVSGSAVGLRGYQVANRTLDRNKNILIAASLYDQKNPPTDSVDAIVQKYVIAQLIDLATGEVVAPETIDPATYDSRQAAKDPNLSTMIEPPGALPGIKQRAKVEFVYLIHQEGQLNQIVLPIYGKGLWSTLYGFLAIDAGDYSVRGITFYEHKETPGLGGEIENPKWKALWPGKKIFDEAGEVEIRVIKGKVVPNDPAAGHEIDGLSGATITTRGVSDLVRYWVGPNGFGPYLKKLKMK